MGYVPAIGSFEQGSLLTQRFEVLLWESTDEYWRWDGSPFPPKLFYPAAPGYGGGRGKGKWLDVTDATRSNLGSGEPGMGADMLAFRDMLGARLRWVIICVMRIFECTRYELLQAIEHINNDLQHPAEIRLARNFASWNDAKTDIDITYASIVGEGGNVVIDAQGIPDAAGNYFMRIFNSKNQTLIISPIYLLLNNRASLLSALAVIAMSRSTYSIALRVRVPGL
jgi:hypothetical protein